MAQIYTVSIKRKPPGEVSIFYAKRPQHLRNIREPSLWYQVRVFGIRFCFWSTCAGKREVGNEATRSCDAPSFAAAASPCL